MGFGGRSSEEKERSGDISEASSKLFDIGDSAIGRSKKTFKFFKKSAKPAINFWKTILDGDRSAIEELLGPELNKISSSVGQAKMNISETAPRGGGSVAAVNNLDNAEAMQVSNLFSSARPKAAENLGNMAGMFGNMSLGETGLGINALESGSKNLFSLNAEAAQDRDSKRQAWGSVGRGVGSLAGGVFGGK